MYKQCYQPAGFVKYQKSKADQIFAGLNYDLCDDNQRAIKALISFLLQVHWS